MTSIQKFNKLKQSNNNMKSNLIYILSLFIFLTLISGVSAVGLQYDCSTDSNVIACYHFNVNKTMSEDYAVSPGIVYDSSKYKINNLTYNSSNTIYPLNNSFIGDGYIKFNGINSTMNTTNSLFNFDQNISFSISFFIKLDKNPSTNQFILGKRGSGTPDDWDLMLGTTGYLTFRAGSVSITNTYPLNDSTWHYVVLINQRSIFSGTKFYIDGVLNSTGTSNRTANLTNYYPLQIGKRYSGAYFNGSLDELIIFNKSLQSSEVYMLYNNYKYGQYCLNLTDTLLSSISIDANTILCKDNYLFNTTYQNHVMRLYNNNTVLDCNNSLIQGNFEGSSRGIYMEDVYYPTIKNCFISGYDHMIIANKTFGLNLLNSSLSGNTANFGLRLFDSNGTMIFNNIFLNNQFDVYAFSGSNNITVYKNIGVNSSRLLYVNGNYSSIFNVTKNILSLYDVAIQTINSYDIKIFDNIVTYSSVLYDERSGFVNDLIIFNNTFNHYKITGGWVVALLSYVNKNNINITGNYFYNSTSVTIGLQGNYDNLNINYNNFSIAKLDSKHCGSFISVDGSKNGNGNISFNILNSSSCHIKLASSNSTFNIFNNIFDDASGNGDSYNTGVLVTKADNLNFYNNQFINMGCNAIQVQKSNNLNITNNSATANYLINLIKNTECGYEALTFIDLASIWATWLTDGTENISDDVNKILNYSSSNVIIRNNSILGFPVILRASQPINLTHDLSNFWFRSVAYPDYLMSRQDFYISDLWGNITNSNGTSLNNILGERYPGYSNSIPWIQSKVFKNYVYFKNNGYTVGCSNISLGSWCGVYNPYNSIWNVVNYNQTNAVILFRNLLNYTSGTNKIINTTFSLGEEMYVMNLSNYNETYQYTNALFASPNGSVLFDTNINNNDGYFRPNISAYYNYTIAIDNFNVSETYRENSPIWISQSSSTSKHIASNLTDSINATVVLNVGCRDLSEVYYTPNGSTRSKIFDYTCSNNVLTMTLEIKPSEESNEIELIIKERACSSNSDIFSGIIILIPFIITCIVIFGILGFKNGTLNNIDPSKLGTYGFGIVIFILMIGVGIMITYTITSCP